MSMRLSYVVVLVLLYLSLSAFSDAQEDVIVGPRPYTPINPSDPHVVEIAEYAVTEYNKRSGAKLKLKLVKILKADTQVVAPAGVNYRLALKAKDASAHFNNYQAIVYEINWPMEPFKNLTSFKPLPHQH